MAIASTDYYSNEQWKQNISTYMQNAKNAYYRIGYSSASSVSTMQFRQQLTSRMSNEDYDMLVGSLDDFSDCIVDNMAALEKTEIGTYIDANEWFVSDDDCFDLMARCILSTADAELGHPENSNALMYWMRYMFMQEQD